jgi:copper chaperone
VFILNGMGDLQMEKTILKVEGMSCSHCENAVKKSVGALDGVSAVTVDLKGKTVTVEYESSKVSLDRIKSEIEDQGYNVVS